jgi:hypothetical protein
VQVLDFESASVLAGVLEIEQPFILEFIEVQTEFLPYASEVQHFLHLG